MGVPLTRLRSNLVEGEFGAEVLFSMHESRLGDRKRHHPGDSGGSVTLWPLFMLEVEEVDSYLVALFLSFCL